MFLSKSYINRSKYTLKCLKVTYMKESNTPWGILLFTIVYPFWNLFNRCFITVQFLSCIFIWKFIYPTPSELFYILSICIPILTISETSGPSRSQDVKISHYFQYYATPVICWSAFRTCGELSLIPLTSLDTCYRTSELPLDNSLSCH